MSPITGLTDRSPSFKEIGRLRLGIPKNEAAAHGPKEISYFRADFRPDAEDAAVEFTKVYGGNPTSINIRLPFPDISRCWDAFYECYNKTGLLGMSDGERWLYLRHNQTSELLVKDGVPTNATGLPLDDRGMPYKPFDPKAPVYSYKSQKGADVAVFARPTGRLRVLVPELKRAAYIQIITHSVYNIMRISEQLAGIDQVARQAGMNISHIPMVVTRRPEQISVSYNGRKEMQARFLLNIEIDPAWMEAQFRYLNTLLPGQVQAVLSAPIMAVLPAGKPIEPEDLDESEQPEPEESNGGESPWYEDEEAGQTTFMPADNGDKDPVTTNPVQALVDANLCESTHAAQGLINSHYPHKPVKDIPKLLAWAKLYRGWRDAGKDPKDAAAQATAGVVPN